MMKRWRAFLVGLLVALSPASATAEPRIVPHARVVRYVVVREGPSTATQPLDFFDPGETLSFVRELPGWYEVRLDDGRIGYVSKIWTELRVEPAGTYRVHVIDVGTGLAIFVEGRDFTLLYDAGSQDDSRTGINNRVLAYIGKVRPGLTRLDHVVLSHAHEDHMSLLPDIMRRMSVGTVWDSGRLYGTCGYRKFLSAIAAQPGAVYMTARGAGGPAKASFDECASPPRTMRVPASGAIAARTPIRLGNDASMTLLYVDAQEHADANENTLVAALELGGRRILLAGDAEGGERKLPPASVDPGSIEETLIRCCSPALRSEVLVVGHHGSQTSSRGAFLEAVGARHFIISSGPFKYSGVTLPDPEIVDDLTPRGTVWRTDLDDAGCRSRTDRIGSDARNKVGGCDNVVVDIDGTGVRVSYNRSAD